MGAVAAYKLWDEVTWLAFIVAIAALQYGIDPDEHHTYASNGEHSTGTATRLFWTFVIVAGIFIYSLIR